MFNDNDRFVDVTTFHRVAVASGVSAKLRETDSTRIVRSKRALALVGDFT